MLREVQHHGHVLSIRCVIDAPRLPTERSTMGAKVTSDDYVEYLGDMSEMPGAQGTFLKRILSHLDLTAAEMG